MPARKYTTRPPRGSERPVLDVRGSSYRRAGWTPGEGAPRSRGGRSRPVSPGAIGAGQQFIAPARWRGGTLAGGYSSTTRRSTSRGVHGVGQPYRRPPRRPNRAGYSARSNRGR